MTELRLNGASPTYTPQGATRTNPGNAEPLSPQAIRVPQTEMAPLDALYVARQGSSMQNMQWTYP